MQRRLFLKTGIAAGLGLAAPSVLSGSTLTSRASSAYLFTRRGAVPDPPYRLQFNENPRGLSPATKQAILDSFDGASLYGSSARSQLTREIAAMHGLETNTVVMGNGSTDTLRQAPMALGGPGMHLVAAEPTYGDIFGYLRFPDTRVTRIRERPDFSHDIPAMRAAAATGGSPVMVYICQPNNPSGALTPQAEIDEWIAEADEENVYFVIDEAYHDYVEDPTYRSADRLVTQKRNVVVARTFSKIHAMAGLRVGYGLAHPETARKMNAHWAGGIGHQTAAGALASMADTSWVEESLALNRESKKIAYDVLRELDIDFVPSETNFMLHRIKGELSEYSGRMREHGILVGRAFPPLNQYNRVSFGLPEQMAYWADTLRTFRSKGWI